MRDQPVSLADYIYSQSREITVIQSERSRLSEVYTWAGRDAQEKSPPHSERLPVASHGKAAFKTSEKERTSVIKRCIRDLTHLNYY